MALRQMGIARMGNYRPRFNEGNTGGAQGRPKLLHNGTGHGLTGGGGLNAKGTGGGIKVNSAMKPMQRQLRKSKYASNKFNAMKINEREKNRAKRADFKTRTTGGPVMNPHPVGSFMYGQNQWGSINGSGQVDWTAQKPMQGRPVIGFNEALPWLRRTPHMMQVTQQQVANRRMAPVAYHDPIYYQHKTMAQLDRDNALAQLANQKSQVQHQYDISNQGLAQDYKTNVADTSSTLGASNIAGSGVGAADLGDLARQLATAKANNLSQFTDTNAEIGMNEGQATHNFNVGQTAEESAARERWMATHQGEKLPASNNGKVFTNGGITYRQNAQGVPQTWTQAKKSAKPLHPNAKTFTAGNGKVTNIKRGL